MKRARQDDGPCESTPESTTAALLIRSLDLIEPRSNRCTRTPIAEQRNESNLLHRTIEDVASRIKERYRGPGQRITYRVSTPTLHGEPTVEDAKCIWGCLQFCLWKRHPRRRHHLRARCYVIPELSILLWIHLPRWEMRLMRLIVI